MFPVSHHASGGCNIEGEDESWDFGTGAGFYVDSTEEPWKTNYRMYSYVSEEVGLLQFINRHTYSCSCQLIIDY